MLKLRLGVCQSSDLFPSRYDTYRILPSDVLDYHLFSELGRFRTLSRTASTRTTSDTTLLFPSLVPSTLHRPFLLSAGLSYSPPIFPSLQQLDYHTASFNSTILLETSHHITTSNSHVVRSTRGRALPHHRHAVQAPRPHLPLHQ